MIIEFGLKQFMKPYLQKHHYHHYQCLQPHPKLIILKDDPHIIPYNTYLTQYHFRFQKIELQKQATLLYLNHCFLESITSIISFKSFINNLQYLTPNPLTCNSIVCSTSSPIKEYCTIKSQQKYTIHISLLFLKAKGAPWQKPIHNEFYQEFVIFRLQELGPYFLYQLMIQQIQTTNIHRVSVLEELVASLSKASRILLGYLSLNDLIELSELNKDLHFNNYLANRIFYGKCLHLDRTFFYDFYSEPKMQQQINDLVDHALCEVNYALAIQKKRNYYSMLVKSIQQMTPNLDAKQFVSSLNNSFSNPELPLPKLRRQTIGTFCNSNFQLFLAQLNWIGKIEDDFCQFQQLKRSLFEEPELLIGYFKNDLNVQYIKEMRYIPQKLQTVTKESHPLFMIIQVIILTSKLHIETTYDYLVAFSNCCNDLCFLMEYSCRYQSFRNSLFDLEEKVGFLFTHFNQTFTYCYPQYVSQPPFSLWRTISKQWLETMQPLLQKMNHVCCALWIRHRQMMTQNFIQEELQKSHEGIPTSIRNSTSYHFQKLVPTYEFYCEKWNIDLGELPGDTQIQILLALHQQSVIDLSLNEYNVHWCGSTELRMGKSYLNYEQIFLDGNEIYLNRLLQKLQNSLISKNILVHDLSLMEDTIKPVTKKKLISQTNCILSQNWEFLFQQNQGQMNQQFLPIEESFVMNDTKINLLNRSRRIQQQTSEEYCHFFSLDYSLTLQQVQAIVHKQKTKKSQVGTTGTIHPSSEGGEMNSSGMDVQQLFQSDNGNQGQLIELKLTKSYSMM